VSVKTDDNGPPESEWFSYWWPWYRHLPRLGPWLLLVLGIFLPRANRHPHALLLLVPMVILGLLWPRLTQLTGMSDGTDLLLGFLVDSLAVGLALLWLNADKLGPYRGRTFFVDGLGILLLADIVVAASYAGTFPRQSGQFLAFAIVMEVVVLAALVLTRRRVQKHYRPWRFMLWLAVWSAACSVAGAVVFAVILMLLHPPSIRDPLVTGARIAMAGLALSLCLYALNLPYLLLMFTSPFFQRRFLVWLGATPES
jgi:hypothetical protein